MGAGSNGKGRLKSVSDYFGGSDEKMSKKEYQKLIEDDVKHYTLNTYGEDRIYVNTMGHYINEDAKLYFQKDKNGMPELIEKTTEKQIHSTLSPRNSFNSLSDSDDYRKAINKKFGITKKTTFDELYNKVKNKSNKPLINKSTSDALSDLINRL